MEHVSQSFLGNFFQSLSIVLFEDISLAFLTVYYDNFWKKIKAQDATSLGRYFKHMFLSSLEKSENDELKISNQIEMRALYRFMSALSDILGAQFTIYFQNSTREVFLPEVNLRGKGYNLKINTEGEVQVLPQEQDQSNNVGTDSESEVDWPETGSNKKRSCESVENEIKKKKIPLKMSEAKNRNPFMEASPVVSFDTKYNLDQFTEKSEFQHYKDTIRINLQNLKDNTEKLNQILLTNISKINSLLLQETEEIKCQGNCQLHCSLLGRAQIVKKAKGRRGKNL